MRNFAMEPQMPEVDVTAVPPSREYPQGGETTRGNSGAPETISPEGLSPISRPHGPPEERFEPRKFGEIQNRRTRKPFGFALAHGENGASIWWGMLAATITMIRVKKDTDDNIVIDSQDPIPVTTYHPAENLDPDTRLQTHLGWYGNVYGEWDANDSGEITRFAITGPEEPNGEDISQLNHDLTRNTPAGTYYVLIGTVEADSPVDQQISGDIPWFVTILKGRNSSSSSSSSSVSISSIGSLSSKSSSGSSSSSGPSGSSGSFSSGSSKSTCIVPCSHHPEGFAALFLPEMPREGVFLDTMEIHLARRSTVDFIDPRFAETCEPGTFSVIGWSCDRPIPLGFRVDGTRITVTRPWWSRRAKAIVTIHAIRKGFLHQKSSSPYHLRRLPQRNRTQFEANEKFINSAYPSYE